MERNGLTKSERAGATCPKHRRHSIIRAGSPENHTRTLISRSLCTCVRIPCAHRLQVFAMLLAYSLIPRLSHTQHHQHLSLSLMLSLSLSPSFLSHLLFPSPPFVLAPPLFPSSPYPAKYRSSPPRPSPVARSCGRRGRWLTPQVD